MNLLIKFELNHFMKKLLVLLFSIFFLNSPSVFADSNYKTVNLPKGVSIDVPTNWQVISDNQRITLDAYVETLYEPIDSDFPFAANYYNDYGEVDALLNIRYYPWIEINQQDVINATSDEVKYLDSVLYENISLSMKAVDGKILSWNGTTKEYINGVMTLLTEYRRYSGISKSDARVRLVRVINGNKSFTLTVSYDDTLQSSFLLKGITNRIIESLSLSN
jgi:hypothetical protein